MEIINPIQRLKIYFEELRQIKYIDEVDLKVKVVFDILLEEIGRSGNLSLTFPIKLFFGVISNSQ